MLLSKVFYLIQLLSVEQRIMELLPKGIDRPRTLKELMKITGWSSRKVRLTINRLIVLHHQPIGARYERPNNGYFIITNDKERIIALTPLTSQIREMSKRVQIISEAQLESEELYLSKIKKPLNA